jgi:hypothetical protein
MYTFLAYSVLKRHKSVHNSQACFVPLSSRYIFTSNWQKFVTSRGKCLPRYICCTAYCHTFQVTENSENITLHKCMRLFAYLVTSANEITRLIFFLWRNTPSGPRSHIQGFTITFRHTYSVGLLWRLISPMQRPLSDKTQHSSETRHPCTRRDSNLQSEQASGRKPTP